MKQKIFPSARSWGLILPAEWVETFDIIAHVKKIAQKYYIILHDSDFDKETGECKKPHYHVLFTFKSPSRLPTVVNHFSEFSDKLKENSFERINNITGAKRYLVHFDNLEKHQYKPDQVETNDSQFKDIFIQQVSKDEEIDMLIQANLDTLSETEQKYLEGWRPFLQGMSNRYQMLQSYFAIKRDFYFNKGRTK